MKKIFLLFLFSKLSVFGLTTDQFAQELDQTLSRKSQSVHTTYTIEWNGQRFLAFVRTGWDHTLRVALYESYKDYFTYLPFLNLYIQKDHLRNVHVHLFRKTSKGGLKEVMTLFKEIYYYANLGTITLLDNAFALRCPHNGAWCQNSPPFHLGLSRGLIRGKSLYQSMGATAKAAFYCDAQKLYREVKVVDLLTAAKKNAEKLPQLVPFIETLEKTFTLLGQDSPQISLGEVANRLKQLADTDKEYHILWHQFQKEIIIGKNIPAYSICKNKLFEADASSYGMVKFICRSYITRKSNPCEKAFPDDYPDFQQKHIEKAFTHYLFKRLPSEEEGIEIAFDGPLHIKNLQAFEQDKLAFLKSHLTDQAHEDLLFNWLIARGIILFENSFEIPKGELLSL